jgi:hypothetical protein
MDIKIAIATNKNFYELSLPIIIKSLLDCQINKDQIFVFNAGFDQEDTHVVDGITYYFLNHNSYEYSPLIHICENDLESDYWFLIHDTCKVGERFKELLYNIPDSLPDKIALKNCPAMSIGTYKYSYLKSIQDKLFEIKNTDYSFESMIKWKEWGVPNEDYILWRTEPTPVIYNETNQESFIVIREENWYGTGTIRRTEYFPYLDIYKNKSNWGQTSGAGMVITL